MSYLVKTDECYETLRAMTSQIQRRKTDLCQTIKLAEGGSSPTILGVLSNHYNERIRAAVADNPSATCWILLKLAHDASDDIRYQLAENHNVPEQVLLVLATDENPYVQVRAERTLNRLHAA